MLTYSLRIIRRIDKRQLYRCVGKTSFWRGDEISKLSEQQIKNELLEISRDEGFINNVSVECELPHSQHYDIIGSSDLSVIDNTLSQSSYMYAISDNEVSRQGIHIHSLTHLLAHSSHSPYSPYSLTHSLAHSFTHLTHSLALLTLLTHR